MIRKEHVWKKAPDGGKEFSTYWHWVTCINCGAVLLMFNGQDPASESSRFVNPDCDVELVKRVQES